MKFGFIWIFFANLFLNKNVTERNTRYQIPFYKRMYIAFSQMGIINFGP